MKKSELTKHLASKTGLSQSNVEKVLAELNTVAINMVKTEGEFQLHGLVTLTKTFRSERKGKNLRTGEDLTIAEHHTVTAKAVKPVRDIFKSVS